MTRRQTVLVVDDDVVVARAVERELCSYYDVTVAGSAIEALERLRAQRVDVILSDYDLGNPVSGIDFLSLVADCYPHTRRIFYSGRPFTRDACTVAHAVLQAPVQNDDLWEALGI